MNTEEEVGTSTELEAPVKRIGRPPGSKNKPKLNEAHDDEDGLLVAMPKTAETSSSLAERIMLAKQRENLEKKIEEVSTKIATETWTISCRINHGHFGIFFTEDPKGKEIHPGMWYSSYHNAGDPWTFGTANIVCQECVASTGNATPLPINETTKNRMKGTLFRIPAAYERFLRMIPSAKIQDYLTKQEVARG